MCAIALKNIEIMKRERIIEHVLGNEAAFRATLEQLLELPIVGDVRGAGYFYAIELVKDKETRETFSDEECETLLRGFLSPRLFERGLICRADDRGDPVIQISPPLVATQKEFDEMTGILGDVARRGMGANDDNGGSAREHRPAAVETTTTLALEEKRQADQVAAAASTWCFFTVCAFVGLDTLGTVANKGPQGFFWLVAARRCSSSIPYMLLMSEVGSAFTQEGGPYEWVKLAFGRFHGGIAAILYWVTNPLWVGGSLAFIATSAWARTSSGSAAAPFGDYFFKLVVHLDLDRRRDRLAPLRQVDPERRRDPARRRARLLLAHRDHLRRSSTASRGFAARELSPTRAVFFGLVPLLLFNYVGFELQNGAAEEMENPQKDVPLSVLRSGITGVLMYVDPGALHHPRAAGEGVTGIGGFIDAVDARLPRRLRRRGARAADPHDARLRRRADHVGRGLDDRLRPDPGGRRRTTARSSRTSASSTGSSGRRCA